MIYVSFALVIRTLLWKVGEEEMNPSRQSWELYLNLSPLMESQLQLFKGRQAVPTQHACLRQPGGEAHAAALENPCKHQSFRKLLSLISLETKMPTGTPKSADEAKRVRFFYTSLCGVCPTCPI